MLLKLQCFCFTIIEAVQTPSRKVIKDTEADFVCNWKGAKKCTYCNNNLML